MISTISPLSSQKIAAQGLRPTRQDRQVTITKGRKKNKKLKKIETRNKGRKHSRRAGTFFRKKSDRLEIHADSYQVISTLLGLAFCAAATYATNPTPCDRRLLLSYGGLLEALGHPATNYRHSGLHCNSRTCVCPSPAITYCYVLKIRP